MSTEGNESLSQFREPEALFNRIRLKASEIVKLPSEKVREVISNVYVDVFARLQTGNLPDFSQESTFDDWLSKRISWALRRLREGDRRAYNWREIASPDLESFGFEPGDYHAVEVIYNFDQFIDTLGDRELEVLGALLERATTPFETDMKPGGEERYDADLAAELQISPQRFSEIKEELLKRLHSALLGPT